MKLKAKGGGKLSGTPRLVPGPVTGNAARGGLGHLKRCRTTAPTAKQLTQAGSLFDLKNKQVVRSIDRLVSNRPQGLYVTLAAIRFSTLQACRNCQRCCCWPSRQQATRAESREAGINTTTPPPRLSAHITLLVQGLLFNQSHHMTHDRRQASA